MPRRPISRSSVAEEVAGDANVPEMPPLMGGEDFAYMLEARPGAFIFCGNGDSAGLHHPAYNFDDEAIVYGTSYWIKLVEKRWRRSVRPSARPSSKAQIKRARASRGPFVLR